MLSASKITVELSHHEALVLFELLSRIAQREQPPFVFVHPAEPQVLANLEALLKEQLIEPLDSGYERFLDEARTAVSTNED